MLTFDCNKTIYKTQDNFKMYKHYFTLISKVTDSLEVMFYFICAQLEFR